MAARASRVQLVDAVFVVMLLTLGVVAYRFIGKPSIPDDVCLAPADTGPRYAELLADGRITVAAVFGDVRDNGMLDPNRRSAAAFADGLRSRGYVETSPSHFESKDITVDITILPHDIPATGRALTEAFVTHELVYYNGHSDHGDVQFTAPADYRIALMDSCYSTQMFSSRLVDDDHDVISNTNRSITGSVDSLLVALDALRARTPTWQPVIDDMNKRALARQRERAAVTKYRQPEEYRLDARCRS